MERFKIFVIISFLSRNLIVFILVSSLAIGSIIVYSVNNIKNPKTSGNKQVLSGVDSRAQPSAVVSQQIVTPSIGTTENIKRDIQVMNNQTNIQPQDVKELKIEDEKVGDGVQVKSGDTVEVNYLGTLLDGTKFDSSYDRHQTFSFEVGGGQVIQGWDKGLVGMQAGGKRKLTIPSDMAYGSTGQGPIPPNSPLIFEIELVSIK